MKPMREKTLAQTLLYIISLRLLLSAQYFIIKQTNKTINTIISVQPGGSKNVNSVSQMNELNYKSFYCFLPIHTLVFVNHSSTLMVTFVDFSGVVCSFSAIK